MSVEWNVRKGLVAIGLLVSLAQASPAAAVVGNTCGEVISIGCGASMSGSIRSSDGYNNGVFDCAFAGNNGNDIVFTFTLATDATVTIDATYLANDNLGSIADLALTSTCGASTCLATSVMNDDTGNNPGVGQIVEMLTAGTYFILIDAFGNPGPSNTQGYSLDLACDAGTTTTTSTTTTTTTTTSTTTSTSTTTTLAPGATCPASPLPGCLETAKATLLANEKKAGKEQVKMGWKGIVTETTQAEFGDPATGTTSVALCVYDDLDQLAQAYVVDRAATVCGTKACWKAAGSKGYSYTDKAASADGIGKIGYTSGAATKGKASAGGKNNAAKSQTALPTGLAAALAGNSAPTIQMVTTDGFCVGATLATASDDGVTFKALKK